MEGEAEKRQKEEEPLGAEEQPELQVCLGTRCLKENPRPRPHSYFPLRWLSGRLFVNY